jgi:type I restriction enzyme, R subunit
MGTGSVQEKEKALLAEIIARVNDLFGGDTTDGDQLSYVTTLRDKMLESEALVTQAANNTKAQFDNSPTLRDELMNAIIDAFEAHASLSKQALGSQKVREGLKDVLLGPAQLYEALRARADASPS